MKQFILCLLITGSAHILYAQDKTVDDIKNSITGAKIKKDPNDTIPKVWKVGGLFTLTFNQTALSNWSAGGDKSTLSFNSALFAYAFYKKDKQSWDNTLDLAYGFVNTTSQGHRKSDDRMDLVTKWGYDVGKNWYASALFNFRSQFAPGYSYQDNNTKTLTSNFLAPAYVLLSPGFDYKPNDQFSVFLSPATLRWVIVKDDSLSSVGSFGVDSGKHVLTQFGAYVSINYVKKISSSTVYKGRLDLYSNYLHKPQNIDIYFTNALMVKISKLVTMNLTVNIIYDDQTKTVNSDGTIGGPKPQIMELMGIGLSIKI